MLINLILSSQSSPFTSLLQRPIQLSLPIRALFFLLLLTGNKLNTHTHTSTYSPSAPLCLSKFSSSDCCFDQSIMIIGGELGFSIWRQRHRRVQGEEAMRAETRVLALILMYVNKTGSYRSQISVGLWRKRYLLMERLLRMLKRLFKNVFLSLLALSQASKWCYLISFSFFLWFDLWLNCWLWGFCLV